jgi:hypothetical protein|tara:strand:- start:455 stop:1624 length:1170 start_codon:yes stop_codon:yes gene_type:complete
MGLEPYEARYTLQLQDWNTEAFEKRGLDYVVVPGDLLTTDQSIVTGQVLDAHGRSYFGMSQMMSLVKLMKEGEVTSEDCIFFEDMFQPGIESLPYIMDQVSEEHRPKVFVRCLAQSIDPDDFVHVWGMEKWMGLYEKMVNEFVTGVLATNEEMVAHMKIAGWTAPIYNISGLAFGKEEVRRRLLELEEYKPFEERKMRVAFTARWDQEKQPDFYMDLIEEWYKKYGKNHGIEFCLLSGGELRSNNDSYMKRTKKLQKQKKLVIHENLSKNDYYRILNDTRVVFNCALQDWVSNTVSEGDALGCNVLFPAYRSFPETFANDRDRLYIPWSLDDVIDKMHPLLSIEHPNQGKISDWTNGTIDRCIDIMQDDGEEWRRDSTDYRQQTRVSKF